MFSVWNIVDCGGQHGVESDSGWLDMEGTVIRSRKQ